MRGAQLAPGVGFYVAVAIVAAALGIGAWELLTWVFSNIQWDG